MNAAHKTEQIKCNYNKNVTLPNNVVPNRNNKAVAKQHRYNNIWLSDTNLFIILIRYKDVSVALQ